MQNLTISAETLEKLKVSHKVLRDEVAQCFANRSKGLLIDNRVSNATNPPTLWFLAPTNKGRILKIVYIQRDQIIHLRTAYEPNEDEIRIYDRHA